MVTLCDWDCYFQHPYCSIKKLSHREDVNRTELGQLVLEPGLLVTGFRALCQGNKTVTL